MLINILLMIVYGWRYGLVGFNGIGKIIVMKLFARRKIFVLEYIDILFVE